MALTRNKKIMTAVAALAVLGTLGSPFAAYAATANSTITATVSSTITVTSSGAVALALTPTASPVVTSASDTVTVNTNNSIGYTLTLADTDATLTLTKGGDTIAAHAGTPAAPTALATNTWGWAKAGAPFDASYAIETNSTSSTTKWAGISNSTPAQLQSTSAPATNEVTTVWYAAKINNTKATGAYTDQVVYTALAK